MKTLRLTLITSLTFCALFFTSCKKDEIKEEDKKEPTKSELIQANIWMITSLKTGGFDVWNTPFVEICQKDNTMDFQTNDRLIVDEGEVKCSDDDPQTTQGEWKIIGDTKLYLNILLLGSPFNDTADIVSISDTKLVIKANLMDLDGEVTFSKK